LLKATVKQVLSPFIRPFQQGGNFPDAMAEQSETESLAPGVLDTGEAAANGLSESTRFREFLGISGL